MKCDNCHKEQGNEPFWTSRKTEIPLTVCAKCLYELDGIDYRDKSCGDVLRDIEKHRRAEDKQGIIKQLRELDGRMMRLPCGQANAEFDTLEEKYNELRRKLKSCKGVSNGSK